MFSVRSLDHIQYHSLFSKVESNAHSIAGTGACMTDKLIVSPACSILGNAHAAAQEAVFELGAESLPRYAVTDRSRDADYEGAKLFRQNRFYCQAALSVANETDGTPVASRLSSVFNRSDHFRIVPVSAKPPNSRCKILQHGTPAKKCAEGCVPGHPVRFAFSIQFVAPRNVVLSIEQSLNDNLFVAG